MTTALRTLLLIGFVSSVALVAMSQGWKQPAFAVIAVVVGAAAIFADEL